MLDVDDGEDDPYVASTDFEKFDHSAMLDMIQNADAGKVTALAHKLDAVGTKTEKIATDLQTHMGKLDWEGKGGDAFRDWGSRVASATLTLSDYSSNASVFMLNAGQVLGEVQRDMPKVPSNAFHTATAYRAKNGLDGHYADTAGVTTTHLDGTYGPYVTNPSAAQYKSAQGELETARSSAVDQMNKLGQAYNMATDVIATSQEPTFPPTPGTIMPARPKTIDTSGQYVGGGTDSSGGTSGTGGTGGSAKVPVQQIRLPAKLDVSGLGGHSGSSSSVPAGSLTAVPTPDTSLKLDSVGTLPTNAGPTQLPLPTSPVGPPGSPPGLSGMPTPMPMPSGLMPTSPNGMPPVDPRALAANRAAVEREAQGLGGNLSEYGPMGAQGPMGGGSGLPAPRIGGPGSDESSMNSSILGGRSTQRSSAFGGEESAIPRGTVMGGGGGGRTGGSGGAYAQSGGGGRFGSRSSRAALDGERLGAENEGVVGGLPSASGPRQGRNFTSGGEGLSRRAPEEPIEGEPGATGFGGVPAGGVPTGGGSGLRERERGRRNKRRRGRGEHDQHDQHDEHPDHGAPPEHGEHPRSPVAGEETWPAPE
jgi:hypothetical protein